MPKTNSRKALPERDFSTALPVTGEAEIRAYVRTAFEEAEALAQAFGRKYRDRVHHLGPEDLAIAFRAEEECQVTFERGANPAQIVNSADQESKLGRELTALRDERGPKIDEVTAAFDAELAKLPAARLLALSNAPALQPWRQLLIDIAEFQRHALSPAEEQVLAAISPASAWIRAYDRLLGAQRYTFGRRIVAEDVIEPKLQDKSIETRRKARAATKAAYAGNRAAFAEIMDEILRLSTVENEMRGYARPEADSLIEAGFDGETLDVLVATGEARVQIVHDWNAAKLQSVEGEADLAALWGPVAEAADITYSYQDATLMVVEAWARVSPDLGRMAQALFDENRIDAKPRPAKEGGAWCMVGGPEKQAHIHVNFYGEPDDVLELAHEVGHAIHDQLAQRTQRQMTADSGLVVAESASTLSENLTFEIMLERATSPEMRRGLLGTLLERRIGTNFNQLAYHRFELKLHALRKSGPLDADQIEALWEETLRWLHGKDVNVAGEGPLWARIGHFFQSPFYVWTYAAAETLAASLFTMRQDEGFAEKLIAYLRAGGSQRPRGLLEPFGLDIAAPSFWNRGFDFLEELARRYQAA